MGTSPPDVAPLRRDRRRPSRRADCVNDWAGGRALWDEVGAQAGAGVVWLEIVCSDAAEHRRRVETRQTGAPGLILPDWDAVMGRVFDPWERPRTIIDTATQDLDRLVEAALAAASS